MSRLRTQVNLILKKLATDNPASLRALYDLTFNHLKIIAMTYAKDKNDWEDILQDAYVRVSRYIYTFDSSQDGYNWLCKIVQRAAYDFYRKRRVTEESFEDKEYCLTFTFDSLEDSILEKDALLHEISKLPEEDQKLLYLKFWECKSYREMEQIFDSARSTLHKRTQELLKILAKNL